MGIEPPVSEPDPSPAQAVLEEPPPFLKRWPRVYAAVILYLAALIVVFYAFTVAFRP